MKSNRTIRFHETVQVNEIEKIESSTENRTRRASWDPYITDQELSPPVIKAQGKVITIIALVGLFIVVGIIAIVLGVVLSRKSETISNDSLSFGQVCTAGSKQCKSTQNLHCPFGFCQCIWPFSWSSSLSTCKLLLQNQLCSNSSQCDNSTGLACRNNLCECDSYHRWNSTGNLCVFIQNNTLTFSDPCLINGGQCNAQAGLVCSGTCNCTNGKNWNVSQCSCPTGTFLNSSNHCETLHKINETCSFSGVECDTSRNLFCNNSLCSCDMKNFYWDDLDEICALRLNYSQICLSTSQCSENLFCSSYLNYCNCPLVLSDHTCNCYNTMYFDFSTRTCVNRSSFGGPCLTSANFTCLSTLFCQSGICSCPTGTSWFSLNSTCV